mgnify:FL=1
MFGIVIVAHGGLAQEYLLAAEHVVGVNPTVQAISIYPKDDVDEKEDQIKMALSNVNTGSGVIIVTDIHGSTPANLALKASKGSNFKVIFGANLPLIVKLIKARNLSADDAVKLAVNAGKKYISCASTILSKSNTNCD